jgi:hypothetical protein
VRRRIIQQPLRTEAPFALIVGDASQTGELEARLKRAHPLITFPSFSHFLAEPARREPWGAIIVARAGAWDSRLDYHVRRRSCIALFGLSEESYGWPEAVARVRDLAELEPWLEALNAPEPVRRREVVKRETRAQAKAALSELTANWMKQSAQTRDAQPAATTSLVDAARALEAAPDKPEVTPSPSSVQLELATMATPHGDRKTAKSRPPKSVPAPAVEPDSAREQTRERKQVRSQPPALRILPDLAASSDRAADLAFTRIAAELGLARAFALLDELRERARQLAWSMSRDAV